ncbi:MAG: hypothetical protein AB1772_09015 [Candidatus Zixiibacteriota bacterium]
MTPRVRLVTRIALLSALIYVLSWVTSYLPGVNAAFFIAFLAGYIWGGWAGAAVGALGMWLWTTFNPLGPAAMPIALSQIFGLAACGLMGRLFRPAVSTFTNRTGRYLTLLSAALACTVVFYAPVSVTDAWVFGPFWPRLIGGLPFVAVSLAANAVIFPLLFGATRRISEREGNY